MAIADTITSMQNHTSNAYTMIGYGTDLTGINKNLENLSNTIFEAFLEALRNPDTLFNNLPKTSASGSQMTLNGTANAPMRITLNPTAISQDGTPTPSSPQDIHTISGNNSVVVDNGNGLSQTNPINLGEYELGTIGDYKNRIFKNIPTDEDYSSEREEGAWYYKQGIGKVVLNGSESGWANMYLNNQGLGTITVNLDNFVYQSNNSGICNYFIYKWVYNNPTPCFYVYNEGNIGRIMFVTQFTAKQDFITWLSTHNTTIYYVLATPTYTKITGELANQLEQVYKGMLSYDGTTNISQVNNDLSFELVGSAITK